MLKFQFFFVDFCLQSVIDEWILHQWLWFFQGLFSNYLRVDGFLQIFKRTQSFRDMKKILDLGSSYFRLKRPWQTVLWQSNYIPNWVTCTKLRNFGTFWSEVNFCFSKFLSLDTPVCARLTSWLVCNENMFFNFFSVTKKELLDNKSMSPRIIKMFLKAKTKDLCLLFPEFFHHSSCLSKFYLAGCLHHSSLLLFVLFLFPSWNFARNILVSLSFLCQQQTR